MRSFFYNNFIVIIFEGNIFSLFLIFNDISSSENGIRLFYFLGLIETNCFLIGKINSSLLSSHNSQLLYLNSFPLEFS